jgi:hypothetical protein
MRLSTSTFWVLAAILNAFEGALIFMFSVADEGDHVIWGTEEFDEQANELALPSVSSLASLLGIFYTRMKMESS